MSDVTEAPTQDEVAESLLGDEGEVATDHSEQPSTGTDEPVEAQPAEPSEQQPEEQAEEAADDWLPTEQEKVFPDDVLVKYAARYGLDEQKLADPLLKQLVVDKINSDIYLRQQQAQEEEDQVAEEPQPEPSRPQTVQPTQQEYFENLSRVVQARTDPAVAKQFHDGFLRVFGVPEAEIAKAPPQQAMALTTLASTHMLNLINTFFPDMLQARLQDTLGQAFPGFSEMYERSAYAMAWDRVRNSSPEYQNLPAYGSKEFGSTLRAAAAKIPGFDEMIFTGKDGRALSPMENSIRKYTMLARIAAGKTVNPETLRQAVAAGARQAKRSAQTRNAGNLGSGQSKSAGDVLSRMADDDPLKEGLEIYQRQHGHL